jgi:hypothetical protein
MTERNSNDIHWLRHHATSPVCIPSCLAAGAVAVGTLIATATDANAEPISEGTIKSECKAAGGTYTNFPSKKKGGMRISSCTYKDINGNTYNDDYYNGEYAGTSSGPA